MQIHHIFDILGLCNCSFYSIEGGFSAFLQQISREKGNRKHKSSLLSNLSSLNCLQGGTSTTYNDRDETTLAILSLVSLKACIYRAGQCEEVSHHCCLVTAALQAHLAKPQSAAGPLHQCTSKHHPADCVSGRNHAETEPGVDISGRRSESPGKAIIFLLFCFPLPYCRSMEIPSP